MKNVLLAAIVAIGLFACSDALAQPYGPQYEPPIHPGASQPQIDMLEDEVEPEQYLAVQSLSDADYRVTTLESAADMYQAAITGAINDGFDNQDAIDTMQGAIDAANAALEDDPNGTPPSGNGHKTNLIKYGSSIYWQGACEYWKDGADANAFWYEDCQFAVTSFMGITQNNYQFEHSVWWDEDTLRSNWRVFQSALEAWQGEQDPYN